MKLPGSFVLALTIVGLLAASAPTGPASGAAPLSVAGNAVRMPRGPWPQSSGPRFGPIVFCEDVTDDGEPVNPTDGFPSGATQIWAYFTYDRMMPGQSWGRHWQLNGETYLESSDQPWEEDESGWVAYSVSEENGLAEGEWTLSLYIGERLVQLASVEVAAYTAPQSGYFGAISFATEMTDEREPVDPSRWFDFGVRTVFAIFDYRDMREDQVWAAEWMQGSERLNYSGDSEWGGEPDGVTWLSFEAGDGLMLAPGEYALNLYLDGELVRSAAFLVGERPTPEPPSRPEDIVDPELLPAWHRLASCAHPTVQRLSQVALKYHIPIRFGDAGGAFGAYRFNSDACNTEPGEMVVSREKWNDLSWEEAAGLLAHELWHATQLLENGYSCGCTVEKEVEASIAELAVLRCLGREDILLDKWAGAWDWYGEHGKFNEANLWTALEEAYSYCPKYEP